MSWRKTGLILLMWAAIGLAHGVARYADIVKYELEVPFSILDVGYYMLAYASWIVITVVLMNVLNRPQFVRSYGRVSLTFLLGLLLWLPLYFAYDYGIGALKSGGGWQQWLDAFARTSGSVIFFYAVVYALTFTICLGVAFSNQARTAEQRTLELQRQKAQTALELSEQRMQTMQSQLSPHFLFNCLSSISFLARQAERDRLVAAIAKLGSLLRFTIENAAQPRIPLVEEVRFVEDYIGLQSLRFGERFQWTLVTDIEASSPVCPPFSIQPLVENVFRHAVERFTDESQSDPVRIELTVKADASSVEIRVCNTRTSDADQQTVTAGFGIGEKNLETRLKHTYGAGYSLESFKSGKAFCVELRFPPSQPEQVLTGI